MSSVNHLIIYDPQDDFHSKPSHASADAGVAAADAETVSPWFALLGRHTRTNALALR